MRAVPSPAFDVDFKQIGRGHHRAGTHADDSGRKPRPIMQTIDGIARKTFEQAIVEHCLRTAQSFFGGLENQNDLAIEIEGLGQISRSEEHTSELQSLMRISYT